MKKFAILGAGNLGGAIARGLVAKNVCAATEIVCTAAGDATLVRRAEELPGISGTKDNLAAARSAETVILTVKPWLVEPVLSEIRAAFIGDAFPRRLVSAAAGVTLAQLRKILGPDAEIPIFVAIPNTAIAVAQSMTFVAAEPNAPAAERDAVGKIFSALGRVVFVPETQLAAGTALASCGIAFAMRYVRASTEGAVELGLRAALAREAALQTLLGAAELLLENGEHPESAIDKVTTPGGLTIRGLNKLEECGFSHAVVAALRASCSR